MCGIAGFVSFEPIENAQGLTAMNNLAKHRGPDDEGYILFDINQNKYICAGGNETAKESWEFKSPYQPEKSIDSIHEPYQIGLAHRRLSILDLSPMGHLPMSDETSKYWITYNGEVYNFIELRGELEKLGHNFKTNSDTEVVLKAYIQWGKKCVEYFEGMFAIVIVDLINNEVFLARDIFGIKPLYYWVDEKGVFYFASEIKQFTDLPGWRAILNKPRAFDYLYYSLTDHTEETLFRNVFQFLPANRLVIDLKIPQLWLQGKPIVTENYFKFRSEESTMSFEKAKERFKQLFEESVKLHLRSDVKIGSALSGGIDSTAIVCQINSFLKAQGKADIQNTFSAISDHSKYSEKPWMDEVIKDTHVKAHFVSPKKEDVFKLTPRILWHMDEPYQSQSAFLGYHVFELASKNGVKVLLNGQGADEFLSGYEEFRFLRWYRLFYQLKWIKLSNEFSFYFGSNIFAKLNYITKFITNRLPSAWATFFTTQSSQYKAYSKIIPPKNFIIKFIHPFKDYPSKRRHLNTLVEHQLYCSPLPRFLRWEDRNSMAHAVEARVPFLYKPLIDFSTSVPLDYLDGLNQSKKLMLESLKNLLPKAIYSRKDKKGFITPEEDWVRNDKDGTFEKLFKQKVETLNGLIDKEEAIKFYTKLQLGQIPFDYLYWRIILLAWWIEIFNIEVEK